jgi:23S rRNA pseudouridine1911/1915/1917 synthase
MNKKTFSVEEGHKSHRLDSFITSKSGLSRASVQRLIKQGLILVNTQTEKPSYKIRLLDSIELTIPHDPVKSLSPENVPLEVLWEDEYIVIVNKQYGMVVHPGAGHRSGTLMNALAARCEKLASIGAPLRPGVVHRLDKDTSGILIVAKDDSAFLHLQKQFKNREVEKYYYALLYGNFKKDRGEKNSSIGRALSDGKKMSTRTRKGKEAVTRYEVVNTFKSATLAEIRIITGRTHQIRVHFAAIGHPVLGDKTYGKKTELKLRDRTIRFNRQMLHAYRIRFKHPVSGEFIEISSDIPEDMQKAIGELSKGDREE